MTRIGPPPMKAGRVYVNPGEEDQMVIYGYKKSMFKTVIIWFFILITVGLLRLFFYWLPHLFVKATHSACSLREATAVLLKDQWMQWFDCKVKVVSKNVTEDRKPESPHDTRNVTAKEHDNLLRYFVCKKVKYIWNFDTREFFKLRGFDKDHACSFFYQQRGLSNFDKQTRQILYGLNSIRVHVTPIIVVLFKEVLSPFYVFQAFSVCVWYSDEYYVYATVIIFISVLSIIITIYQTRKMQRALRSTISSATVVTVCRGQDEFQSIMSEELVPGDVIEIPRNGCIMQCDAVLVSGNCIINESMLTGESFPVTKTPLPNPHQSSDQPLMFDMKQHSRHVLFCGTHVIQTRFYGNRRVTAVVVRTGFMTAKGELVRSILFPKPVDFKFNRDSYKFIGVLAFIAFIGFVYTIVLMVGFGDTIGDIIIRTLDLLTIAVPPALPAALGVGIVYAQQRLRGEQIYCISPRGINICGTINTVCFDKTGTLTEDGLNMMCVTPASNGSFEREIRDMGKVSSDEVVSAMATCHSLTIIEGEIMGDPLDLIMFESIDWNLIEPGEEETRFDMIVPTIVSPKHNMFNKEKKEIAVVKQFPFSSSLQRMSVVTRKLGAENFDLFVKGAPEMIVSLSKSETVPSDFHDVLMAYTQHGYRVIALAWKPLPQKLNYVKVQRITREQVENDLIFLGLLVMENCLKPETTPIMRKLREADIRNIMVTGDNMLTALSVARECCMVDSTDRFILVQAYPPTGDNVKPEIEFVNTDDGDKKLDKDVMNNSFASDSYHFAVTGKSWAVLRQYFPDVLNKIVVRGTVFARMGPDQKAQLIETLQLLGYYVGMCGDGANDCGALKTAHTGISLSEAEASVASPFTSKKPTIECVPTVIREGRAALVTSFGIFKYMACYSLTQFVTVLFLYWIGANITDVEFLYIDLPLVLTLSVTFGRTEAYPELVKERPPYSLMAFAPVFSIVVHMAIQIAFQAYCFFHVMIQPWFVPFIDNEDDNYVSYENAAIFLISSFQYITLAVAFSKGAPFRKSIFTNYWFLLNIVLCTALCTWVTIYPTQPVADLLELETFPSIQYGTMFIGLAIINFLLSVMVETYLLDNGRVMEKFRSACKGFGSSQQYKYQTIEQEISENPHWPPVNTTPVSLAAVFQRLDSAHHVPKDVMSVPDKNILEDLIESEGETTLRDPGEITPGFVADDEATMSEAQTTASNITVNSNVSIGASHVDDKGKITTSL